MSGFLAAALGYREFWTEDQISALGAEAIPDLGVAEIATMLIFATSTQQSWLAAGAGTVACILDDRRKEDPRVQWSMPIAQATPIRVHEYSRDTGLVDIGPRKDWLYSKRLFQTTDVATALSTLLQGRLIRA